jgi:hypothetical protein
MQSSIHFEISTNSKRKIRIHLHILHVHAVVSRKIDLPFGLCKNTKFASKNKIFYDTCFVFLHRLNKMSVFRETF